ncbi:MAG: alpha/beta hydrolase [Brevundimonas sp.]
MVRTLAVFALMAGFSFAGCDAAPVSVQARPDSPATQATSDVQPSNTRPVGRTAGVWRPPSGLEHVPIWPGVAPDMEGRNQPPESVLVAETPEAIGGRYSEAVFDVTTPTMTVFPPQGESTGAAVVVFPGGGFRAVVLTVGGTEICAWLTAKGITCILSKYRVPGSNHHWDETCRCAVTPDVPRALQDAQRTIRLVRARAADLNIDPDKIGVMGFSAGGYLVAQTSNIFEPTYTPVDAIDAVSSRPDFAISVYPGHLCRPGRKLDPGIRVTSRTPPTFIAQAWDDPADPVCNSIVYAEALDAAGVQTEVHLFATGGHNFGLRRPDEPVGAWPALVETWLKGLGILPAPR